MTSVNMRDLCQTEILGGAGIGRSILSQMIAKVPDARNPTIVLLDFRGIGIATSSFLREAVLGFRSYCRIPERNLYPILANMNEVVAEEMEALLLVLGDAMIACTTDACGAPISAFLLGKLEPKQEATLRAVLGLGEADAPTLMQLAQEKLGHTGWNNRLAALVSKGILIVNSGERIKRYRPVLEGLAHGN